jgi:hypothetical protein
MKMLKSLLLLALFFVLQNHFVSAQQIKYKRIKPAKGTLNWKLEDANGNIVSEGKITDGEWRQAGAILKDYLILDKDENNKIKTALVIIAGKKCPLRNFAVQFYHDGEFYPKKNYYRNFQFSSKPDGVIIDTNGELSNAIYYDFGAVTSKYRAMTGCFINRILIPNSESSIKISVENKYSLYILGDTDYKWGK